MYMQPSVRKGLITEPTSAPFVNYPDTVCIQDGLIFPEFSQEASLQYLDHHNPQLQQSRLQSPFQYQQSFQFVSPPSSAPSSPSSSPASSISHYPASSAVPADYTLEAPSMTPASSYNPTYHFQGSASPQSAQPYLQQYPQQFLFGNSSMLAQQPVASVHGWEGNPQLLSPARIQKNSQHKTSPSSSSSSRSAPAGNSYQRGSNGSAASKPLPTPVQTPVQNTFLATPYQNFDPSSHDGSQVEAELAMRRAVMEQRQKQQQQQQQQQHHHQQQQQSSEYSLAPSVSSVSHNSPVTPQTTFEELDDASKAMVNDYGVQNGNLSIGVPKLNRTISDIYQDELYNPTIMPTAQASKPTTTNQQNLLTPYRNVFADRLQAANQGHMSARSQSPTSGIKRERSPFRQNSPFSAEYNTAGLQQPQMATSMPMTQNVANPQQQSQGEPNTMSPKDAVLDFNEGEDHGLPLFPTNQPDFNLGDTLGLRRESSSSFPQSQNFTSMDSFPSQYATNAGVDQQFPFGQQQTRQQPSQQDNGGNLLQQTPTFPPSLPTFESTGSDVALPTTEMASPPAAQAKLAVHPVNEEITRPENTSADSGTYTCTYHNCTLRFDTPARLQKHKREAHRQTTPGGHMVGRDTAASRNTQAGPHRCERINPSTGKPCNSIFSRPYDLTRHEDTIHNARKQKVRCHLCTEEKTFSRNDALTRHMRVVHPEVDWPGKQRRKGRE